MSTAGSQAFDWPLQNDSLATLLARMEGILGPLPRWMLRKGRYSHRFYTRAGVLYEQARDTVSCTGPQEFLTKHPFKFFFGKLACRIPLHGPGLVMCHRPLY